MKSITKYASLTCNHEDCDGHTAKFTLIDMNELHIEYVPCNQKKRVVLSIDPEVMLEFVQANICLKV